MFDRECVAPDGGLPGGGVSEATGATGYGVSAANNGISFCPFTHRPASVLWKPPGAESFASRQKWARQVAYASQFKDRTDRAHYGQAKIKSRLCSMGGFDLDEWDFPPKPKWMRWRTYNRAEEKFNHYESVLDERIVELVARLGN